MIDLRKIPQAIALQVELATFFPETLFLLERMTERWTIINQSCIFDTLYFLSDMSPQGKELIFAASEN